MKIILGLIVVIYSVYPPVHANTTGNTLVTDPARIQVAQYNLKTIGLDPGPLDGIIGSKTKSALTNFQRNEELPVTGLLDEVTFERLALAAGNVTTGRTKPIEDPKPPGPGEAKFNREEFKSALKAAMEKRAADSNKRFHEIEQRFVRGNSGWNRRLPLIPEDAIPFSNSEKLEIALGQQVFLEFAGWATTQNGRRTYSLPRTGSLSFNGSFKDRLPHKSPYIASYAARQRKGERCTLFPRGTSSSTTDYTFCFQFYRDRHSPDILYMEGLPPRPGINNGGKANQVFVLWRTFNGRKLPDMAAYNKQKYGDRYVQRQISNLEMGLEILRLGATVDRELRSGAGSADCPSVAFIRNRDGSCRFVGIQRQGR